MPTIVVKSIGSAGGRDYATLQGWDDECSADLTRTRTGTTQAGSTSSTIVLDSGASATDDYYNGHPVWCDARATEKRLITDYVGATKVATIGALNSSAATWANTPGTEAYTLDSVIWKGECYNDSEFLQTTGTVALTITGTTTSATCYMWLTAASGESFIDDANVLSNALKYDQSVGVGLRSTSATAQFISIAAGTRVTIDRLQFYYDATPGSDSYRPILAGAGCTIKNIVYQSRRANLPDIFIGGTAAAPHVTANSVFISNGATASSMLRAYLASTSERDNCRVIGCTIVRASDLTAGTSAMILGATYGPIVIDCAAFGFTTPFSGTIANYGAGGYNASDVAAAGIPGSSGNLESLTYADQFVGTASTAMDFRTKTGADLIDAGQAQGTYTGDKDVAMQDRSATTPTIGAWEGAASEAAPQKRGMMMMGVG